MWPGGHGWSPCWSCRTSRVCSACSRTCHHRGHDRHVPVGFAVVSQGSTMVRFQQACFLSVARPSISQGSAMVWFHLSVSGPVRSGNERVAEGTGWFPCWSCRLAPGWICSSLSNVSPPWTWISMCPWGSVPASVVGLVAVNHGSISRRDRGPRPGTAPFCNLWWGMSGTAVCDCWSRTIVEPCETTANPTGTCRSCPRWWQVRLQEEQARLVRQLQHGDQPCPPATRCMPATNGPRH